MANQKPKSQAQKAAAAKGKSSASKKNAQPAKNEVTVFGNFS